MPGLDAAEKKGLEAQTSDQLLLRAMAGTMSLDHVYDIVAMFAAQGSRRPGLTDSFVSARSAGRRRAQAVTRAAWLSMLSRAPVGRPFVRDAASRLRAKAIFGNSIAPGSRDNYSLRFPHFLDALLLLARMEYEGARDDLERAGRLVRDFLLPLYHATMGREPAMADDDAACRPDLAPPGAARAWTPGGASVCSGSVVAATPSEVVVTAERVMSSAEAQARGLRGLTLRRRSVMLRDTGAAAAAGGRRGSMRGAATCIASRSARVGRAVFYAEAGRDGGTGAPAPTHPRLLLSSPPALLAMR